MTVAAISAAVLAAVAPLLSVDESRHSVTFTATMTEVSADTPLEFLFIGPDSDRAYEAMFVTDARVKDIAAAFDKAGIPRGGPVGEPGCRFWPTGRRVTIEPDVWQYVKDTGQPQHLPVLYTGGTRDADGVPVAEKEMPSAVLALYSAGQSLMQLDDALDQSVAYGRFLAASTAEKGRRVAFTVAWDGVSGSVPYRLALEPGTIKERLEAMRGAVPEGGLDVLVDFSPELEVREAAAAANALALLDSRKVRINGLADGQFFYRAFLPLEKWRDRKERLTQPLEVRLSGTNAVYTVIDEDWSVEGVDPKLTPRTVDLAAAREAKADTCFVYAPAGMKLSGLYELRGRLPKTFRNWYVYSE